MERWNVGMLEKCYDEEKKLKSEGLMACLKLRTTK
jgi:hypothetical protein